jgi:hypothetical protein
MPIEVEVPSMVSFVFGAIFIGWELVAVPPSSDTMNCSPVKRVLDAGNVMTTDDEAERTFTTSFTVVSVVETL